MILARKINKILEFYMILPGKNARFFFIIIAEKYFYRFFWGVGGGGIPHPSRLLRYDYQSVSHYVDNSAHISKRTHQDDKR